MRGCPVGKKKFDVICLTSENPKNLTQNVMSLARAMLINLSDLLFDSPPEVRLSVAILIDCRYPSLWLLFKQLWF